MRSSIRFATHIRSFSVCAGGALVGSTGARAQSGPPVRDLGPVIIATTERIGLSAGVWEFANGKLLVSDGARHRLLLFDASLASFTVVGDSSGALPVTYRSLYAPLIPFTADSVLFLDFASHTMQLIDGSGAVARTVAPVNVGDMSRIRNSPGGTDSRGRMYYRGSLASPPAAPGAAPPQPKDSAPIVRADFDSRKVDTLAMLQRPGDGLPTWQRVDSTGKIAFKTIVNPVVWIDDWAVLPDGSIAIVRGHDYHVDWIAPDGVVTSSPKLPFDWRRLTEDDKRNLIDSVRLAFIPRDIGGRGGMPLSMVHDRGLTDDEVHIVTNADGYKTVPVVLEFPPLSEIPDYVAPIRASSVQADRDGNIWILPTTSSHSRKGGLVYDVVNRKGELFDRVELPAGRSLVAFGRGGVVYLLNGNRTSGFAIERARIR